ncbi:MAG: hypothetical protein WC769_01645 [Thermodesulfovibrionales bacterium]|jgi:hypothetical protein
MSQLKNSEGLINHLQRLFYYGDEMKETSRVNSFLEYILTKINPFTNKVYELGARSLYRYISGEQHFPFDLIIPLCDWSADETLMAAYNIRPSTEAKEKLEVKREKLRHEVDTINRRIEQIDGQIDGFEQLSFPKKKRRGNGR